MEQDPKRGDTVYIQIDGDRYRMTIPSLDDALWLLKNNPVQDTMEYSWPCRFENDSYEELLAIDCPYGYKRISFPTSFDFQDYVDALRTFPKLQRSKIHTESTMAIRPGLTYFRPMLIPVYEDGWEKQNFFNREDEGQLTYGGVTYHCETKQPVTPAETSKSGYELKTTPIIGDSLPDRRYTLTWAIHDNRLICCNTIGATLAVRLWKQGLI